MTSRPMSAHGLDDIREVIYNDTDLQLVIGFIRTDWPQRMAHLPSPEGFDTARAHLSESDGLALSDISMVLPIPPLVLIIHKQMREK